MKLEKYQKIILWTLIIIGILFLLNYFEVIDFSNLFSITDIAKTGSSVGSSGGGLK